jgi:prevent-host-death family protein
MPRQGRRATVHEAKTHLSRLIERAIRGEDVVIHRGNEPVVRLVPVARPLPNRKFGAMKDRLRVPDSFFDALPEDELDAWGRG